MAFDFDALLDRRGTWAMKWDAAARFYGVDDVIPLWVADIDIPAPPVVVDALRKRVEHPIYGYPMLPPSYWDPVVRWLEERQNWAVRSDWLAACPGVVPALNLCVQAFSQPGDTIVIQTPVYHPFYFAVENNGRRLIRNPLRFEGGRWMMDLDDLARRIDGRTRMLVLCSPHNPVGRVWSRDELAAVGEIALANDAIVVSDEIHCELLLNGSHHVPFASLSPELEQNSIVCMAPSKTFNLAGLATSFIVVSNPRMRAAIQRRISGAVGSVTPFGYTALEASFREGDDWLTQVLHYIEGNVTYVRLFVQDHMPRVKVMPIEGTYLMWLDFRALGMDIHRLSSFLREKARVGLDEGYVFGPGGEGFARMNIACPRSTVQEGLTRIAAALQTLEQR